MDELDLNAYFDAGRERVERALERCLPMAELPPGRLHQAMRYAVLGGGKRIRPILCYATAEAIGLRPELLDGAACALELIHAYSLVHDDLPAMDDDDLRRGRPTCHKAFDEATAILAGDALQTLALQILAADEMIPGGSQARLGMIETLTLAAGSRGMAGGQALDLEAEGRDLDIAQLESIHIHKTGALIRAAVRLATLAKTCLAAETASRLDHYAKCLGLAFQIRDDILDVEGDPSLTGKARGQDAAHEKATYPALLGLAATREAADVMIRDALASLDGLDQRADALRRIAEYVGRRDR